MIKMAFIVLHILITLEWTETVEIVQVVYCILVTCEQPQDFSIETNFRFDVNLADFQGEQVSARLVNKSLIFRIKE